MDPTFPVYSDFLSDYKLEVKCIFYIIGRGTFVVLETLDTVVDEARLTDLHISYDYCVSCISLIDCVSSGIT